MNRIKIIPSVRNRDYRDGSSPAVVSILSGKGGVGKSVIAYNLAERLGDAGKKILLVDYDLSCGNLHILSNQNYDAGLDEYTSNDLSLNEATLKLTLKLNLLSASKQGIRNRLYNAGNAVQLIQKICRDAAGYDLVIIDHSSGISESSLAIAHVSDLSIIVVVPELTSISDGYGLFKHLIRINDQALCSLLINRIDQNDEAEIIYRKLSAVTGKFLHHALDPIGWISEDAIVRKAVASQMSIADIDENSKTVQEFNKIANSILNLLYQRDNEVQAAYKNEINVKPAMADIRE